MNDDEITRRLEWATGYNGHTLLEQIRDEGLDVIATKPEQVEPHPFVRSAPAQNPLCATCGLRRHDERAEHQS